MSTSKGVAESWLNKPEIVGKKSDIEGNDKLLEVMHYELLN